MCSLLASGSRCSGRGFTGPARCNAEHYAVSRGFDFNDDRDGIWWEGTAQAALVYRAFGRTADADRLLTEIGQQLKWGRFISASNQQNLTTGLGLSPASKFDEFYYYRLPHLGATAWAALAAVGWNPFTGAMVEDIAVERASKRRA